MTMASTPPCGPVHLELPRDVALAPAKKIGAELSLPPSGAPAYPGYDERSPVTARLAAARRPIVLIGDEALEVSQDDLVRLVERAGGPALQYLQGERRIPGGPSAVVRHSHQRSARTAAAR